MSAIPIRASESEGAPTPDSEKRAPAEARREGPAQLLREVIASLNSSNGELLDQTQMADLLKEAREALEHANAISRSLAECQEFLRKEKFEEAFQALDRCLQKYPTDPTLISRRREVEEQQKAFVIAAAVKTVLEEAKWLLDQDRPDLAAQLLREKSAELPDRPSLIALLNAAEALLPEWENNRDVRTALERSAALERLEQWQAALTILEEAALSTPRSEKLMGALAKVREKLAEGEREKRLGRRVKLIEQKIAAQSWKPAIALIEDSKKEFWWAPELEALRREAEEGLNRSERETVITEVRQCMADGDLELAAETLNQGIEILGDDPSLAALREELESEVKYQEQLRSAQVHFGRHQLQEAEEMLADLVAQNRLDAQALLDAVRQARSAAEEANFCERGRDKALKLMQQQQYAQAFDLLTNLRGLFPHNAILERDWLAAQEALRQSSPPPPAVPEPAKVAPAPVIPIAPAKPAAVQSAAPQPAAKPKPQQKPAAASKAQQRPEPKPVVAQEPKRGTSPAFLSRLGTGSSPNVRRLAAAGAASLMLVSAGRLETYAEWRARVESRGEATGGGIFDAGATYGFR